MKDINGAPAFRQASPRHSDAVATVSTCSVSGPPASARPDALEEVMVGPARAARRSSATRFQEDSTRTFRSRRSGHRLRANLPKSRWPASSGGLNELFGFRVVCRVGGHRRCSSPSITTPCRTKRPPKKSRKRKLGRGPGPNAAPSTFHATPPSVRVVPVGGTTARRGRGCFDKEEGPAAVLDRLWKPVKTHENHLQNDASADRTSSPPLP